MAASGAAALQALFVCSKEQADSAAGDYAAALRKAFSAPPCRSSLGNA